MRIHGVRMAVSNLADAEEFYRMTLELPVRRRGPTVEVKVGWSVLTLWQGDASDPGVHHCAFTVPANRFAESKAWLGARVRLLGNGQADEFALGEPWNSQSVYFAGPDGILLEFIARHQLPDASTGPFVAGDLMCVSEIGVALPSVSSAVTSLGLDVGLQVFGSASEDFAAMGDHEGLLIVVQEGRPWFPTFRDAPLGALTIEFEGGRTLETSIMREAG